MDQAFRLHVSSVLADQVATGGRRLGIVVAHDDTQAAHAATALLQAVGLAPRRRLARLRPRPDEADLRAGDLTDFVRRYGHEYAAVLLPHGTIAADDERTEFEAICRQEGCNVDWHD